MTGSGTDFAHRACASNLIAEGPLGLAGTIAVSTLFWLDAMLALATA